MVILDRVRPEETMPSTAPLMRLTSASRFSLQARIASAPDRSWDDTLMGINDAVDGAVERQTVEVIADDDLPRRAAPRQ